MDDNKVPAGKTDLSSTAEVVTWPTTQSTTTTTAGRHEELTFGIEVEMVVAGLPDDLDVYNAIVETMMKLPQTGKLNVESETWFDFMESRPDRSKFLVQKDASIDDRLFNIPMGRCAVGKIEGFDPSPVFPQEAGRTSEPEPFMKDKLGDSSTIEQGYYWCYEDIENYSRVSGTTIHTHNSGDDDWEHDPDWWAANQLEVDEDSSPPTSVSGEIYSHEVRDSNPLELSWPDSSVDEVSPPKLATKLAKVTEKALRITENGFVGPVVPINDAAWVHGKAVEICTPIMTAQNYDYILKTMINHLNSELDIRFNRSTGLHVHVGCGEGKQWSHAEINALAKAVIVFERLIDRMHPETRLDHNSWMIGSNRSSSILSALTISEIFEYFDSCKSGRQLGSLVSRDRFVKYNFTANDKYGTVEFRQALGTSDPKELINWVRFVHGFVKAALDTTKEDWEEWGKIVGMGTADETLKLGSAVLDLFGIPEHIRY